jgi:dTDP-4-dehydrorhamnose reductase
LTPFRPNLLILGGSSLLALNWALHSKDFFNVYLACHNRFVQLPDIYTLTCSYTSVESIQTLIQQCSADLVVNCIANTNVDLCQVNPSLADHANTLIASWIAIACTNTSSKLIHISTDHLFSGISEYYSETSAVEPVNYYGLSKSNGENAILDLCPNALIIRTNFFCWSPSYRLSFSDRILSSISNRQPISLFTDVFITPLLASNVALLSLTLARSQHYGIFNLSSNDKISKFNFGLLLCSVFNLDTQFIKPSIYCSLKTSVPRPADMSLSNQKAQSVLGPVFGTVSSQVKELANQYHTFRPLLLNL